MRTFTQKWAFLLMALLCLVVSPQVVFADDDCLVIGNGTATSSWHLPISTYYHNSYSQQLFLADEITDGAGQITEIAFQYNTATSTARGPLSNWKRRLIMTELTWLSLCT